WSAFGGFSQPDSISGTGQPRRNPRLLRPLPQCVSSPTLLSLLHSGRATLLSTRSGPSSHTLSGHSSQRSPEHIAALCPPAVDRLRRYISPQRRRPGNGHASRITNLLAWPSAKTLLVRIGTLEDAAVRQVCLTLRLMRLIAQP